MFSKSARIYDAIYSWKDYVAESAAIHTLIQQHKRTPGNTLLDAACGTGQHARRLRAHYAVEGFDLDTELLAVARERCPNCAFYVADMVDFDLGKQYDAVTCLFSAIGYVVTAERLNAAIVSMARHVKPGGVLIVEAWFSPDEFRSEGVFSRFVEEPDLRIARMHAGHVEGNISYLDFHYMVGTPEGVEYFTEQHKLGLFTVEQYRAAFDAAGLETTYDPQGISGRGLYIGVKPT